MLLRAVSAEEQKTLTMLYSLHTMNVVMERRFKLGTLGNHLWTRDKGRQIRSQLRSQMENLRAGDALIIDADGIEAFDFSFADELFVKAMMTLGAEHPGRFLVVENLNECTNENLVKALESSNLAMIERGEGKLRLLGKVHPADAETFEHIVTAGDAVSAAALGKKLNLNLTAMNERLSKLTSLGVVRREKGSSTSGREQYVYRVLS
jgi:predicted transcriptional regulator